MLPALPATRPTYTAVFERAANGSWMVELAEEPNVQGYGDTLVEARRNIRDAIATLFGPFEDAADGFELVEEVRLPEAVLALVARARRQRDRAQQQRDAARAAEVATDAKIRRATEMTRRAAHRLVEHGRLMDAAAGRAGQAEDVRLPDEVLEMVERAHLDRRAADQQRRAAAEAQEAATTTSSDAIVTNREAARVLVEQCGLTVVEAAGLLGLSPARAQRLLTG